MRKQHELCRPCSQSVLPAADRLADLSAQPIYALTKRKEFAEFLEALVKRAPVFSNVNLSCRFMLPLDGSYHCDPVERLTFPIRLRFKGGTFRKFAERQGVYDLFLEFFGGKYFDKLQRRYERALSLEADRILRRRQRELAEQLSLVEYERVTNDLCRWIFSHDRCPPTQLIVDVFNEIAIRFTGNGTPERFYQHVIYLNMQRTDCERETREYLGRLGSAAVGELPKEMFDKPACAIMLFSADEMSCGIPPLTRWRDEAGLRCIKLACDNHSLSMDVYRARFRKLGLSAERPKLVKCSEYSPGSDALEIEWAVPVRNLAKTRTDKTSFCAGWKN
jgi:hypothetical protein